ncbi:MAG: FAS1-like dehydratase domain-containing protein, partial [Paracraurococcus sp.]
MSSAFEIDDICALPLVRRLAVTLDQDPLAWTQGDILPRGWHVALFTPLTPQGALTEDGHVALSDALPHFSGRLMLGGRRTAFPGDIRIGDALRRRTEVVSVTPKQGRSGRLTLVRLEHCIFAGDSAAPAIIEEQDMVFLEGEAQPRQAEAAARQPDPDFSRTLVPDERLPFRYSAVTFNVHRIHFDAPYGRPAYDSVIQGASGMAGL